MTYLESIKFPNDYNNAFPYCIPAIKYLGSVDFSPITIFAGGNGTGKSTILNVIAEKMTDYLPVKKSVGNITGYFNWFVKQTACKLYFKEKKMFLPESCRLIKSEDIMDNINRRRHSNEKAEKRFKNLENFALKELDEEMFGTNKNEQEWTDDQRFNRSLLGYLNYNHGTNSLDDDHSNGESSMSCFKEFLLEDNSLYLLDEPENSLAPKFQLELINLIEECTRYFNCQFIIATHSPFILSLNTNEKIYAKIYDLNSMPVCEKYWYELGNMKEYAKLFLENKCYFK